MNDEQSKRVAEAADALLLASDAIEEAREAATDKRFESEFERERTAAIQQVLTKIENAGKRLEDAIRRGTVASAANGRAGAWSRYREALAAVRYGRFLGRTTPDQDGIANKRARSQEAISYLDNALAGGSVIVFGDEP